MEGNLLFLSMQASVIACAVVAGVFLTFSDFVMRSLDAARPTAGVEVMQVINREVYKTVFMALLLGWSVFSLVLMAYAYTSLAGAVANWILAGGAVYLVGVFAVSLIFNVPMNRHLDGMKYTAPNAATYWAETYRPRWTRWNTIRVISAAAAAGCYLMACIAMMEGTS